MNKVQIAQLAGVGLALLIGLVLIFNAMSGGDKGSAPSRVTLINVVTGEVTTMRASQIAGYPVLDDLGRPCLFPAEKNENGGYVVQARFLTPDRFEQFDELAINPETGSLLE